MTKTDKFLLWRIRCRRNCRPNSNARVRLFFAKQNNFFDGDGNKVPITQEEQLDEKLASAEKDKQKEAERKAKEAERIAREKEGWGKQARLGRTILV